ncbi:hypothetical protein BDB00DRAFT_788658 [Zychaea mexicana]|uniref:uncharacterized protein n=1 Tax=Zychaea mexicana TaxID=64656 RepID=UPI0022FF1754|nr:uncharacterized protein BDB00DRAFT_788658 [Zychaea mexicana]KAI9492511.1 hypothetical protein BDB00DRAFT_788658 [Zychaea mexicana]
MIDNSDTELLAIRKALGDNCRILICHWHILRAWRKQSMEKVFAKDGVRKTVAEIKAHRQEGLQGMIKMMMAGTKADYELCYLDFSSWCLDFDDEWDPSDLLVYFDCEYSNKKEKWSNTWRHQNLNIDTNNYIESWHHTFKESYLSTLKKQHVDVLVYILWDLVLRDVMEDHIKTTNHFQSIVMNASEKKRQRIAYRLSEQEA